MQLYKHSVDKKTPDDIRIDKQYLQNKIIKE